MLQKRKGMQSDEEKDRLIVLTDAVLAIIASIRTELNQQHQVLKL